MSGPTGPDAASPPGGLTYRDSGVDLDLYAQAMERIPSLVRRTHTPRVIEMAGGFAGLFRLDYNSRLFARNYRDPVLVSGTDGVGTKVKVAAMAGRFDTVGIDLVAMCVNDCLCLGAEPLFFLDYLALPKDDPDLIAQLVKGISDGCVQAEMSLLGGETAIMPDLYQPGDLDMAGFSVGVVERRRRLDGQTIRGGDVLLGVASSGIHSNGYSLVRKIVFDHAGLAIDSDVPDLGGTVADVLLEPTRIYARALADLRDHYKTKTVIRGIAHITGGGLAENLERILPPGRRAVVRRGSWTEPPVFGWLQKLGNVAEAEMDRVFNRGVGLVLVLNEYYADSIARRLAMHHLDSWVIGRIEDADGEAASVRVE